MAGGTGENYCTLMVTPQCILAGQNINIHTKLFISGGSFHYQIRKNQLVGVHVLDFVRFMLSKLQIKGCEAVCEQWWRYRSCRTGEVTMGEIICGRRLTLARTVDWTPQWNTELRTIERWGPRAAAILPRAIPGAARGAQDCGAPAVAD